MILRRRRVRIELEQSTIRIGQFSGLEASPVSPVVLNAAQGPQAAIEPVAKSEFSTVGQLSIASKDEPS
jgi:hypothetical protein